VTLKLRCPGLRRCVALAKQRQLSGRAVSNQNPYNRSHRFVDSDRPGKTEGCGRQMAHGLALLSRLFMLQSSKLSQITLPAQHLGSPLISPAPLIESHLPTAAAQVNYHTLLSPITLQAKCMHSCKIPCTSTHPAQPPSHPT
jgi:hypothetical protein